MNKQGSIETFLNQEKGKRNWKVEGNRRSNEHQDKKEQCYNNNKNKWLNFEVFSLVSCKGF